jgi:hypothetical protein
MICRRLTWKLHEMALLLQLLKMLMLLRCQENFLAWRDKLLRYKLSSGSLSGL